MRIDWADLGRRVLRDVITRRTQPRRSRARRVEYAPHNDKYADPGEIVWTWVEYEEHDGRGKDRPVLVVGTSGRQLLTLMLSSNPDRAGSPHWVSVGSGRWDARGRGSWAKLDRVIVVPRTKVRRIGAILPWNRFEPVALKLRSDYGWE